MDSENENRDMLRKILELEQKNNKMLQGIKSSILWSRIFQVAYWIVILGLGIGAFYYLQPYIDQVLSAYGGFKGGVENVKNLFSK